VKTFTGSSALRTIPSCRLLCDRESYLSPFA